MIEMLQHPFFQNALIAGMLAALLCSFLGVYVVLTRIVFVGVTLAQLASAGVALALLLHLYPLYMALVLSLAGVVFFAWLHPQRRVPMEAVIGISYVFAAAIGILLVALNPVGEARSLNILFGNILSVQTGELMALAAACAVIAAIHFVFYKEFLFVAFDFETAQAMGLRAQFWNLLFYLTLGVAIGFAIRSMGVLLVFAFLVVPAVTARLLARSMRAMFVLAALLGSLSVPAGLYAAYRIDLPTGTAVAATAIVILLVVLAGTYMLRLVAYPHRAAPLLMFVAPLLWSMPAAAQEPAQDAAQGAWRSVMERELDALRKANEELRRQIETQSIQIEQQQHRLEDIQRQAPVQSTSTSTAQQAEAPQPAPDAQTPSVQPAPQAVTPPPPSPEGQRLPAGLLLNPEMRVEGNFVGAKTSGLKRAPEAEGFPSDRLSLKEVELGFRAEIDPFAGFEAIISGQHLLEVGGDDAEDGGGPALSSEVELEEAFLTFPRLPGGLFARLGRMRTSFGEFSDSDPEEFPQIDAPNVVVQFFGEEGEGWTDTGANINYQFGNPWSDAMTHVVWLGVYSGDNEVAFNGGEANRPVWFARTEAFVELGPRAGTEFGLSYATGHTNAVEEFEDEATGAEIAILRPGALRTHLANIHFEYDWQPPVLTAYRGFNFLGEVFYANVEELEGGNRDAWGTYALAEYRFARQWSAGGRLDYVDGCPFLTSLCNAEIFEDSDRALENRREWAVSPILTFQPSRFLSLRAQYKHTERNYGDDSDDLLLQALFIIGFERPDPF